MSPFIVININEVNDDIVVIAIDNVKSANN